MVRQRLMVTMLVIIVIAGAAVAVKLGVQPFHAIWLRIHGQATIESRVAEYGSAARERLQAHFAVAGVKYPPTRFILAAFKAERRLDVVAVDEKDVMTSIVSYRILGASGMAGPKTRRGDHQVPEGLYRIESLNPNSAFHLALRLNYPNGDDRTRCRTLGIEDPGGDIMIHGRSGSDGCLAMGDPTIEELFVLAVEADWPSVEVIVCPYDFRDPERASQGDGQWGELYAKLRDALAKLPGGAGQDGR